MERRATGLLGERGAGAAVSDASSIDANEITDKGYINQRLALEQRAADVARLFAAQPDDDLILT